MTVAGAVSKRKRLRYPHHLRRGKELTKWNTTKVPTAARIEAQAVGGGIVKILLKTGYGFNANVVPVVEWSLDNSTGWTAVAVTGWTAGARVLTTAAVATGAKYFRVKLVNTFGTGPVSNSSLVTVT